MAERSAAVDDYIAARPGEVQVILQRIRELAAKVVPGAGEKISYQMPTVTMNGNALLYYAGWKKHIGMYPIPVLDEALEARLGPCRSGQDSVKFPLREPIPYDLIEDVMAMMQQRRADEERDRA